MDLSNFARLSPELRNSIFELVLLQSEPLIIQWKPGGRGPTGIEGEVYNNALSLLATCRQLRQIYAPFFYSGNRFQLSIPHAYNLAQARVTLDRFLDVIGPNNALSLRAVHILITNPFNMHGDLPFWELFVKLRQLAISGRLSSGCALVVELSLRVLVTNGPGQMPMAVSLDMQDLGEPWDEALKGLKELEGEEEGSSRRVMLGRAQGLLGDCRVQLERVGNEG